MKTMLSVAPTAASSPATPSFSVCCSTQGAAYQQLTLEDEQGCIANWVLPIALNKIHKKPVMLWLLPPAAPEDTLACLESGTVQPMPTPDGTSPNLRTKLAQGLLQLNFEGKVLRGYHRLRCLPEGAGQLWQLTPIV